MTKRNGKTQRGGRPKTLRKRAWLLSIGITPKDMRSFPKKQHSQKKGANISPRTESPILSGHEKLDTTATSDTTRRAKLDTRTATTAKLDTTTAKLDRIALQNLQHKLNQYNQLFNTCYDSLYKYNFIMKCISTSGKRFIVSLDRFNYLKLLNKKNKKSVEKIGEPDLVCCYRHLLILNTLIQFNQKEILFYFDDIEKKWYEIRKYEIDDTSMNTISHHQLLQQFEALEQFKRKTWVNYYNEMDFLTKMEIEYLYCPKVFCLNCKKHYIFDCYVQSAQAIINKTPTKKKDLGFIKIPNKKLSMISPIHQCMTCINTERTLCAAIKSYSNLLNVSRRAEQININKDLKWLRNKMEYDEEILNTFSFLNMEMPQEIAILDVRCRKIHLDRTCDNIGGAKWMADEYKVVLKEIPKPPKGLLSIVIFSEKDYFTVDQSCHLNPILFKEYALIKSQAKLSQFDRCGASSGFDFDLDDYKASNSSPTGHNVHYFRTEESISTGSQVVFGNDNCFSGIYPPGYGTMLSGPSKADFFLNTQAASEMELTCMRSYVKTLMILIHLGVHLTECNDLLQELNDDFILIDGKEITFWKDKFPKLQVSEICLLKHSMKYEEICNHYVTGCHTDGNGSKNGKTQHETMMYIPLMKTDKFIENREYSLTFPEYGLYYNDVTGGQVHVSCLNNTYHLGDNNRGKTTTVRLSTYKK